MPNSLENNNTYAPHHLGLEMPAFFEYNVGMSKNQKIQYTVRGISPAVDKVLRKKAKEENKSLNEVLVQALQKEAGMNEQKNEYHDLDFLIGTWVHDSEVDEFFEKDLRKIDEDVWK
jgi:hypothetical protein